VECTGKTKRKIVLIDYETGHKFTLKITVEEGEVTKMSLPKYEELIAPGSPELGFFEGDMKLNADQIALLKKTEIHDPAYATDNKPKNTEEEIVIQSPNNEEPSGNAVIGTHYRWPQRRVTYQLHNYLDNKEKNLVRTTLRGLQAKLDNCLQFVETSSGKRIYVKNNLGGCYSMVGFQDQPTQDLSLQRGGCMSAGIIEHEFLHAIGLFHHQSRSDRDNYVRIIWEHIPTDKRHNFKKYTTEMINHYNLPYDYRSIMHYGGKDFGAGRMTIQTLDSRYQNIIGQRKGVSDTDIAMVKKMYGCNAPATTAKPATTTVAPYVCTQDKFDICPDFKASGHCTSGNANVDEWMKKNCYKSCEGCLEGFGGPDDWKFCQDTPCSEGQGDCDNDDECAGSLVCGKDNCRTFSNYAEATADCCMVSEGGGGCAFTDNNENCAEWAKAGYCTNADYQEYMNTNCGKSCKCSTYNCQEVGINYQARVDSQVFTDVTSWDACRQLCAGNAACNHWVWNNSGAGTYKHRCAIMRSYGNKAADVNTVAGPKTCS